MRFRVVQIIGNERGPRGIVEFRQPLGDNAKLEIVEWTGEAMARLLETYNGDARAILAFFERSSAYSLERISPGQGA